MDNPANTPRSRIASLGTTYAAGVVGGIAAAIVLGAMGFGFWVMAIGAVAVPVVAMIVLAVRRGR